MGKLTKLKEDFKIENIKEAAKNALEKIGMGMIKTAAAATIALSLAGGFMGCNMNPEIDYCDVCEGIQDEYHVHEQPTPEPEQPTPEQPTPEQPEQPTPEQPEQPEQPTPEQPEQPKPEKEKCTQDGCLLDKHDDTIKHDYCDEYGCKVEGNETDDTPHQHCEAEDCKDYEGAYTGEHNHVCKDAGNCVDSGNFDENGKHIHDYCKEDNCVKNGIDDSTYPHKHDYCGLGDNCYDEDGTKTTDPNHIHDYCKEDNCKDKHTDTNGVHPTEPTYPGWFQEATIGGENSPYKAFIIDNSAYNETNDFTAESKVNDYLDKYIEYINGLKLNKELTGDVEINFDKINELGLNYKLDGLIGSLKDESGTIFEGINGINDVCKLAITEITKNIGISGNNALDKAEFKYYFWAIENEIYKDACGKSFDTCGKTQYEAEKNGANGIIASWEAAHTNRGLDIPFDLYITENNTTSLNPQIFTEMDKMVNAAVTRFNNQGRNITKKDIYDVLNLSWTASSIEAMHDYLSSTLLVNEHTHTDECYNNEMVDTIGKVKSSDMTAMVSPKLNKSIFSQDMGRELC